MGKLTYVLFGDDWEGIYINGKLFSQNHSLAGQEFVDAINSTNITEAQTVDLSDISEEDIEKLCWELPEKLNDLKKFIK
jgi:hypothetical protein